MDGRCFCKICGVEFESADVDPEIIEKAKLQFDGLKEDDMEIVCEDCYKKVLDIFGIEEVD